MGAPVVVVDKGGTPVTISTNGLGAPIDVAANGLGIAVTLVDKGGLPVAASPGAFANGAPAPEGFHWEFVTNDGALVTAETSSSSAEPVVALVGN